MPHASPSALLPRATAFWLALALLAVFAYGFGLGGQYIPTNGDEMVYVHIARETAETGQWLPLASELAGTRNTKPPLLFWQAMVAGDWGARWTLDALRTPSQLYLLLTTLAIVGCMRRITQRWHEALLAAVVFLAFFSTFRYGRAYLTSAPETFWLGLPLFALLWQRARQPAARPGWGLHALFGLGLGLGLAYKSFALIAPAAAAWWLALVVSEARLDWRVLMRHSLRTGFSAVLALGVFGLWFVLDPDPQAVWREFVVAENAGKFAQGAGWWSVALRPSGTSIWSQLLAYPVNAGLLFFAVLGLGWQGVRRLPRLGQHLAGMPAHQRILLAWTLVWLLTFMFPSQRSARYVIPAMPAVAMLLALHWRDIPRAWFVPTLLLSALALLVVGRIAWVVHELDLSSSLALAAVLGVLALTAAVILGGLWRAVWTRGAAVLACLLVYLTYSLAVAPLDGPRGRYDAATIAAAPSGRIAVPNGFNSQFERFQFLLPGDHAFEPYATGERALGLRAPGAPAPAPAEELAALLAAHDGVVWIQSDAASTAPPCRPGCEVLGERWMLRGRLPPGDVTLGNLWYPQEWLFRREWLLVRSPSR